MKIQLVPRTANNEHEYAAYLHQQDAPLFKPEELPAGEIAVLLAAGDGAKGGTQVLRSAPGARLRVLGLHSVSTIKHHSPAEQVRIAAAQAVRAATSAECKGITFVLDGAGATAEALAQVLDGALAASYRFQKYKSSTAKKPTLRQISIVAPSLDQGHAESIITRSLTLAAGVQLARDLVNEPPAELVPTDLAAQAQAVAKTCSLKCQVLNHKQLAEGGYNGVLAVGRGSQAPPVMIVLQHQPKKTRSAVHLALVGKAVTFDTGGYSIKPAKDMWQMKGDMGGGAAVLGAMQIIAQLNLPIRVTAIIPSAQNCIGPGALLPGDVIRSKRGHTVHVDNTDAEGRLLLMEALQRATEEGATHVIDIATLTGSVVRALGTSISGLFATDDALAGLVRDVGEAAGELYWRLPLHAEYFEGLKHDVADLDNSGKSINNGAITAALFLQEFVAPEQKWVHLDIAGTFLTSRQWKYFSPGATGVGVRTLAGVAEALAFG